jgi:hypothetical protein
MVGASILVGGMASAIMLASKAVPDQDDGVEIVTEATAGLERISADLATATRITLYASNRIVFEVPDRDTDGNPEQIAYRWSGTAGDPLQRRYNGGSNIIVVPDVSSFNIGFSTITVTTETSPESKSETSASVLASEQSNSDLYIGDLDHDEWYGQTVLPTLPKDATAWRPTGFAAYLQPSGMAMGEIVVKLHLADQSGLPGKELASVTVAEYKLPAPGWMLFEFKDLDPLPPDQPVCLVLAGTGIYNDGQAYLRNIGSPGLNRTLIASGDGGKSWSTYSTFSLLFGLYGTALDITPANTDTTEIVKAIRLRLQLGGDVPVVETTVRTINLPERP